MRHHREKYECRLPIWVAIELLDWGALTKLFSFSPPTVQNCVAQACGLGGPQLMSWLKALNQLRNICAHHCRLFNRVFTITAKLPPPDKCPDLRSATSQWNRTFGQLTLVQFLLHRLDLGQRSLLPDTIKTFPKVKVVPITHLGVTPSWQRDSQLWRPWPGAIPS